MIELGLHQIRITSNHGSFNSHAITQALSSPQAGDSPLDLGPIQEDKRMGSGNPFTFFARFILGNVAGFYYFLLPWIVWVFHKINKTFFMSKAETAQFDAR